MHKKEKYFLEKHTLSNKIIQISEKKFPEKLDDDKIAQAEYGKCTEL